MNDLRFFARDSVLPYLRKRIFGKPSVGKFLSILVVGISLTLGYNLLIEYLQLKGILPDSTVVDSMYELPRIKLILNSLVYAPIFEEFIFRGLLYMVLRHFVGFRVATLISAISFGVYHMDISQGIYAFLFAFALVGIIRAYYDLLSAVLLHFVANATAIFMTVNGIIDHIMKYDETTLFIVMISGILLGNLWIIVTVLSRYKYLFNSDFTN